MTSLALQNRALILDRLSRGEYLTTIAKDIGYSYHTGIVNALQDDPEYKLALKAGARAKLDMREQQLEGADEAVTVTRARELLAHARWMAKATDPDTFGDKHQNTIIIKELSLTDGAMDEVRAALAKVVYSTESVAQTPMLQCDSDNTLDLDQESEITDVDNSLIDKA